MFVWSVTEVILRVFTFILCVNMNSLPNERMVVEKSYGCSMDFFLRFFILFTMFSFDKKNYTFLKFWFKKFLFSFAGTVSFLFLKMFPVFPLKKRGEREVVKWDKVESGRQNKINFLTKIKFSLSCSQEIPKNGQNTIFQLKFVVQKLFTSSTLDLTDCYTHQNCDV